MVAKDNKNALHRSEHTAMYVWAISITALVLLIAFGIISANNITKGTTNVTCVAAPGFSCRTPFLNAVGNISFTFEQNTGVVLDNVGMACTEGSALSGGPSPSSSMIAISGSSLNLGTATNQSDSISGNMIYYTPLNIPDNYSLSINELKCFNVNGKPFLKPTNGHIFDANIWINYTNSSSTAPGNWITQKIAVVNIKAG